jgi:hypothetical protein
MNTKVTFMIISIALLALSCTTQLKAQSIEKRVVEAIEKKEERMERVLRSQMLRPFPSTGLWKDTWLALAAYHFNEETDKNKADSALIAQRDLILKEMPNSMHWRIYILARVYNLYASNSSYQPGRMSPEAEQAVLDILLAFLQHEKQATKKICDNNMVWDYWGSENHHLMMTSSIWSAVNIFTKLPKYRDQKLACGTSMTEMIALMNKYYKQYFREKSTKGIFTEVAMSGYAKYSLNSLYNIYDFTNDDELKTLADKFLNLYFTDWGIEQINGVRGGSRHRSYPGRPSSLRTEGLGFYSTGIGVIGNHPAFMGAATTSWKPHTLVVELAMAQKERGVYELYSRRPGLAAEGGGGRVAPQGGQLLRYTYHTPQFIMGMSMVPALSKDKWVGISSQNRRNFLTFYDEEKAATIHTQRFSPARGSVYNAEWGVQNKGVMILQVLPDKLTKAVRGQMVFFDEIFTPIQKDGWAFVETPTAYCAIKIVCGESVLRKATKADFREGKGQLKSTYLELKDKHSPIIFEVCAKEGYSSFEAFQKEIIANELEMEKSSLSYSSRRYENKLTLYHDYSKLPEINGETINLNPDYVYKSPYMNADFDSRIVEIQHGDKKLTLDFNK